jgi:hypothetical protein
MNVASLMLVAFAMSMPTVMAQDTDFSGTWTLDAEASQFPEPPGAGSGRGGRRGSGGLGRGPATVVIEQTDDVLTMERQLAGGTQVASYRLDGVESMNAGPRGQQVTTSRWEDGSLVTEGTMAITTPRGDRSIQLREQWTQSENGQELVIESTLMTPRGEMVARLVYRR